MTRRSIKQSPHLSNAGQRLSYLEPKLRLEIGSKLDSRDSSEALISILRSTLFLLEHYGYGGHDPSLSELQRSIGRAIRNLQPESPADNGSSNGMNSLDLQ